ncbi:L-lactate dehydrogenase [Candidatus Saccharibacteria bacterium]|nr:L-lactate dehydrogenase [Candidatus Saccharibacteria bacterium]
MNNKVAIIGTGNVGMSYAYALLNQQSQVNELLLVDINKDDAEGEALDLRDALAYAPSTMKIRAGEYADCADADIVCICAGARQAPGETRMDLIRKNAAIFKDMIAEIKKSNFDGIFLVVSNPVDVMTYLTWHYSGFPRHRVIGSGTTLDTSRLRVAVGSCLEVDSRDVRAYVIGEHGDSGFVPWSKADIGYKDIGNFISGEKRHEIEEKVRNAAYTIINKKGSTYYGIGMALARITKAIFNNENTVLPVSNHDPLGGIFYGYPAVVGREGIKRRLELELSDHEQDLLMHSIHVIKDAIDSVINENHN